MFGAFPLEDALSKIRIAIGIYFSFLVEIENSRRQSVSCLIARMICKLINVVWMSLTRVVRSPFNWLFAYVEFEWSNARKVTGHHVHLLNCSVGWSEFLVFGS